MARNKRRLRPNRAGLAHLTIYTASITGALGLSGLDARLATWLTLGVCVFASHWWIDGTSAAVRWMHFFRQSDLEIVRIVVDQTLHLLVLVLLIEGLSL